MGRLQILILTTGAVLASATVASAQWVGSRGDRQADRQQVARAQGVSVAQLPPPHQCRVVYADRTAARQPSPTSCGRAEDTAARSRNARVIYGEDVYRQQARGGNDGWYGDDDRAVRRGTTRNPRAGGGILLPGRGVTVNNEAYRNGYRDGLTKGRDDGEDGDRYDVDRHGWYRSGDRGYDDDEHGSKRDYQVRYRDGFQAGYNEGYRVYARR